jgi:hypothetical protein
MLTVSVMINTKYHTVIGAVRMKPRTAHIHADTICTYRVVNDENHKIGEVEHRYGDGACVLAMKLLDRFGNSDRI